MTEQKTQPPLAGIRVLEFAGLGPAPFCGMLLADLGADVVRIDRPGTEYKPEDVEARGRQSIVVDLKQNDGKALAISLVCRAHILIEGYRPGVMEKLGFGPKLLHELNPALVYGRITGWGQDGPLANKAGHDINYLALSGALHALGPKEKPAVPLNLIADFGGGALYLAMGVLAALHHAQKTGEGQVVDCAMTEGVISMMNIIYGDFQAGTWTDQREDNVIDGAAPFYNVYCCADGKWLSLACIEPQFYRAFLEKAGLDNEDFADQWQREKWPAMKTALEAFFTDKSRDEWVAYFADVDVCLTPVLSLAEAREHPHNRARGSFQTIDGIPQTAALPRFSKTQAATPGGVSPADSDREAILQRWAITQ